VQMGGNIGTAILSLEPPADDRIHVIECSSFQIDLAPSLAPTMGVHLNLSPDHIDRHGTMEDYAAIKQRLVAKAGLAVIGVDDPMSRAIADSCQAKGVNVARVSVEPLGVKGVFADGETLVGVTVSGAAPVVNLSGIGSLRGAHNAQNAAAAVAVALASGISPEEIRAGLHTFPGLPHRMEEVGRIGSTLFINDSKATNADSTEKALKSFDDILWILGGKAKEGGIEPLTSYFPKIRKAYLIGAAADEFAGTLGSDVPHVQCGTLDNAVAQAAADAQALGSPAVVLLSPACASYDQFPNYEVRGNHFRDLVRALPGLEAKGA
jgi:UDP-N-acetylmuramoylalanine--D-glutamate ligase